MPSPIDTLADARTPLLVMALCIAIGLMLTQALVEGRFGLPKFGVASARWTNLDAVVSPSAGIQLQ